MYGIPGVTQVLEVLQNCSFSACFNEKSSFLTPPSLFSIEKLYFGFVALYPKNNAIVFFNLVSSKPSKIFLCCKISIVFLITFTNIGIIENRAAFVKVVKGVTIFPFMLISG